MQASRSAFWWPHWAPAMTPARLWLSRPAFVRTEVVEPRHGQAAVTLTGEVQARFRADLSFRVSGRVLERFVDGLARLDPAEQQADVDAATAGLAAAESQLRVAQATFDRQNYLLSSGFTTRTAHDQAQQQLPNRRRHARSR
jgi:membrane fusion protein, multidrug efflux system